MSSTPTTSRRARPGRLRAARLALALGAAGLLGGACTPNEAIAVLFPDNAGEATRIADCESSMDPNAVSRTNDHGLFQINAVHQADFERVTGQPWSAVYDPYWNSVFAKHLYDTQGWQPWTCRWAA